MSTGVLDHMAAPADARLLAVLRRGAILAADAGYYVFPVKPGQKIPAVEQWEHTATRNRRQLARRWQHTPYNIGIATGPSRLVVVDLDDGHGEPAPEPFTGARGGLDVLIQLAADAEAAVPRTFTVLTPTGGQHLYFRAPAGVRLRNTQGKLGWHIDTRAGGGFVVAAGSVRPEGVYRIGTPGPVRDLPRWLLKALTPAPPPPMPRAAPLQLPDRRAAAYLQAIVDRETEQVAAAPSGQRHRILLNASLRLGSLVGGGALTEQEARAALLPAAIEHLGGGCDCTETTIRQTIDDGLAFGQQNPRYLQSR